MRKKNYFLMALASLAFMACTSDELIDESGGREIGDNETAWVSIGIRKPMTRALNNPNEHNGIADETNIENVTLLFFNGHSDASVLTNIMTFSSDKLTDVTTKPVAFQVSKNAKSVLVIANPANLPALTVNSTLFSTVNAAVAKDEGTVIGAEKKEFMMTNAKGGLEPTMLSTGADKDLELYATQAEAQTNKLTLFVDRVVAKVRVQALKTSDVATIGDSYWTLNVKNKKYFPVSKRIKTHMNTPTSHDIYELGSYREDPNYNNTACAWIPNTEAASQTNYNAEYTYYTEKTTPSDIPWKEAQTAIDGTDPDNNDPKIEYCLENTQREDDNKHAYTTHVLLKTTFLPNEYRLPDKSVSYVHENDNDWIEIKGGFYTYVTLMEWIEAELLSKYNNGNPDSYDAELTGYLNAYLTAINAGAIAIPDKAAFDASKKSAAEQAANLKELFAKKVDAVKAKGAFTDGTVNYYAGATTYYKIMIKHDDDDQANNKLGEFGVVRNSVYDVVISKFRNPGYPTIPEPDPSKPDESESWLSLEIKVNNWAWYRQVEEM